MATGSYEGSPTGGRHPGSSRSVVFHGAAWTMISAASASSDPYEPDDERTYGQVAAPGKPGEAEGERGSATGVSEARSHRAPWEDNAHARGRGNAAETTRFVFDDDPPKRSRTS